MTSISDLLVELKKVLPYHQYSSISVSKSGVDWHIDHSLKVISGVGKSLIISKPEDYKWKFNIIRLYIISTGHIPRGRGKAPKISSAQKEIELMQINQQFLDAESIWKRVDQLPNDRVFPHPVMGLMKKQKTIRFLRIHTQHHLKIIQDIIKANSSKY